LAALTIAGSLAATPTAAQVPPQSPPFNGNPISPGLGPTYGDPWCANAAPGTNIANQQGAPLALIPQEAVACTLAKIEAEAVANGVPDRMEYSVIGQSSGGRDIHAVVVNALETAAQRRDYDRWTQIRAIQLTNPVEAKALLDAFGANVKMPIFIQANIHGNEEEGTDAMMQVLRDLVTLPRGTHPLVDEILDHSILIVIPMENPDGRFAGTRANGNGFDMNRDFLVQSQKEVQASIELQQEWLAPVALDQHGYVDPTLVDGLTKPHNPGLEYDRFLNWNQRRLDANEQALLDIGMLITRPVNHWNQAGAPPGHPAIAEGWDDWGPFYTQTYMAFLGIDSSTVEMCSSQAGGQCNGRLGSKTSQYVTFYSSVEYWLANRQALMADQLEIFRRGVADQARPACCSDALLTARGFTEDQHNWMVQYPKAYLIPQNGGGQRSNAEANRMVRWLLDNGIRVHHTTKNFSWGGRPVPARSYVVFMNQALRGLALTALSAGQDISNRITQLYAPPGAWSHGLLWGADVFEVPRGDASFNPPTSLIKVPNPLKGGAVKIKKPSDVYAVTLRGVSEHRSILELLRSGVDGEVAEQSFPTGAGVMPAGSLIFPSDSATTQRLIEVGKQAGITFVRLPANSKPPTTELDEAPKVAILVNSANPSRSDTSESLKAIYGPDVGFVSVSSGPDSLQNAPTDPLANYDVIYNTGQTWPANATAQERLRAFFDRGGGYIATSQSTNNFTFLTAGGLVAGAFTQGSQAAGGGIAIWKNAAGASSPVTGGYPSQDFLYLPSNVTYFTATPTGAVIDGRYHENMVGTAPNGPSPGFVSGLWRNRLADANNAPVIAHGTTTRDSRYLGFATNPFSRGDAEREWALIAQTALWSNLTDEVAGPASAAASAESFDPFYPGVRFTQDIPLFPGEKP
jgi:hypothetical protein